MTGPKKETSSRASGPGGPGRVEFAVALAGLESAIVDACAAQGEWPAQVSAAVCAGIDFAIANPETARLLTQDATAEGDCLDRYEEVIGRLAGLITTSAPPGARLPASTDRALVAGIVGLVGDHISIGRLDRLTRLRPDLVLLTLLPYLGFPEAQRWANRVASDEKGSA